MKMNRFTKLAAIASASIGVMMFATTPAMARTVSSQKVTSAAIGDPGGSALTQSYSYAGVTRDSNMTLMAARTRSSSDTALIGVIDTKSLANLDRSQGLSADAALPLTAYRSPSGQVTYLDMATLKTSLAGGAIDQSS